MIENSFKNAVKNYRPDKDKTVDEIIGDLGTDAFPLSIAVLIIPCCIPLPVPPGYTTIFGAVILILSIQWIFKYPNPVLPKFIASRKISKQKIWFIVEKSQPILERIEKIIKPRKAKLFSNQKFRILMGFYFLLNAIVLSIPIPVGNFFSAFSIILGSISMLEKDIVGLSLSIVIFILSVVFTILLMVVSIAMFQYGINYLS